MEHKYQTQNKMEMGEEETNEKQIEKGMVGGKTGS